MDGDDSSVPAEAPKKEKIVSDNKIEKKTDEASDDQDG